MVQRGTKKIVVYCSESNIGHGLLYGRFPARRDIPGNG